MEDRGSKMEDRGSKMEDRGSKMEDRGSNNDIQCDTRYSILDTRHPVTCLCGLCIARRFDDAGRRGRSVIARQLVAASSVEDLCRLTAESRHRLREALSLGYAPMKEREALDKILTAELLEKIPAAELVVAEYQRGIVIKGAKDFVDNAQSRLDQIARVPTGGRLLQSLASRG